MTLRKASLFYLAGYLLPSGAMLVVAPKWVFTLLLSSQPDAYGDVVPRMTGALALALGTIVVQIIRYRLDMLHLTLVFVRLFLVACWIWLYGRTHDPFFVVLAIIVGVGMLLTATGIALERRPA
jgi:hypothetical protein